MHEDLYAGLSPQNFPLTALLTLSLCSHKEDLCASSSTTSLQVCFLHTFRYSAVDSTPWHVTKEFREAKFPLAQVQRLFQRETGGSSALWLQGNSQTEHPTSGLVSVHETRDGEYQLSAPYTVLKGKVMDRSCSVLGFWTKSLRQVRALCWQRGLQWKQKGLLPRGNAGT